ncbi:MAG: hypothetical protein WC488_03835 [Candidatus Micrarchaeia archaeon]
MKGQSALETLVTVSTLLIFTVPMVLLVLSASGLRLEDLSVFHARTTVQQIADTVNEVYLQGDGSTRTILVQLPSNTKSLNISGSSVVIYLSTQSGVYEISHPILANASSFSLSRSGLTKMDVKMEHGVVVIQ